MPDAVNTVYISHRPDSGSAHARAIFHALRSFGYDALVSGHAADAGTIHEPDDVLSDDQWLAQVAARAHFVLLLLPGTLDGCADPDDVLRREIEQALASERHIVPVLIGGFSFEHYSEQLSGQLAALVSYDALTLHHEYFDTAMEKLHREFLQPAVDVSIPAEGPPNSAEVHRLVASVASQPPPTAAELSVENFFARAYRKRESGDIDGAIDDYDAVLQIDSDYYKAHYNRGLAHYDNHSLSLAIKDFSEVIRLNPQYVKAWYNRGLARYDKHEMEAAIADFSEAIRLDPTLAVAYNNRGLARRAINNLAAALEDFGHALRLDPEFVSAYNNRGHVRQMMNDVPGAIADYKRYLDLGGGIINQNQAEIEALVGALDMATRSSLQRIRLVADASLVSIVLLGAMALVLLIGGASLLAILVVVLAIVLFAAVYSLLRGQPDVPGIDLLRRVLGLAYAEAAQSSPRLALTGPLRAPEFQDVTNSSQSHPGDEIMIALDDLQTPVDHSTSLAAAGTRPLPALEIDLAADPTGSLMAGQRSDVGMVRKNNQDAMFSMTFVSATNFDLPDFGLFVVADGMGGHLEGEKASAMTVQIVAEHVTNQILMSVIKNEMDDPDRPAIADVLRNAAEKANVAVNTEIVDGGTTCTAVALLGQMAYIAHVGDSRAYLIKDGKADVITRDHSLVQRLIELGQLTLEQAAVHPQRNVLYRAIGQDEELEIDTLTRRLAPGAHLLLCSDGLWGPVPVEVIIDVVTNAATPQDACDRLVSLANEAGGQDNITIVLVRMPG